MLYICGEFINNFCEFFYTYLSPVRPQVAIVNCDGP